MRVQGMMSRAGIFVIALQCAVSPGSAQPKAFAPAYYDPGRTTPGVDIPPSLHVFPPGAPKFTLPLPFQLGAFAITPGGDALYAEKSSGLRAPREHGLYKIEFGPTRAAKLAGSDRLGAIASLAASSVKVVASMSYQDDAGFLTRCGLYEFTLSTGDIRLIVPASDCKPELFRRSMWTGISLSPDSRKVAALRGNRLEVIDTETKAVQSLGDGFYTVGWSPDGRWIAAFEESGRHTILFDAVTFEKRKTLPETQAIWSPDSRSLLVSRVRPLLCFGELGTLELLNIENGRTTTIRSSFCQIDWAPFGFVNVAAPSGRR